MHLPARHALRVFFGFLVIASAMVVSQLSHDAQAEVSEGGEVAVFGGGDRTEMFAMTVDGSNNIYAGGTFTGITDFDPGTGTANLDAGASDSRDGFVVKLNSSKSFQWVKSFASPSNRSVEVHSLTTDGSGNVYALGEFGGSGTFDFDPGAGTANLTAQGFNGFVVKLDSSGNFVWVKGFIGTGRFLSASSKGKHIEVDGSGNIYIGVSYYGVIDFDPGAGTETLGIPASGTRPRAALVKLDSSGDFVWAKTFVDGSGGGNLAEERSHNGHGVALDSSGNPILFGSFYRTVDFDPGAGEVNLTASNSNPDGYVTKFNSDGTLAWARQWGFSGNVEVPNDLNVDSNNNVYITGQDHNGSAGVDFDPGAGTALGDATWNHYTLKLDSSGNFVWVTGAGGHGYRTDVDSSGNVYTVGTFTGTKDFDGGAGTTLFTSDDSGRADVFVTKHDSSGAFVWAKHLEGNHFGFVDGGVLDSSGKFVVGGDFLGDMDFDPGAGEVTFTADGELTAQGGQWEWDAWIATFDTSGNVFATSGGGGTPAGITLSGTTATVSEAGTTGTFTVVLAAQPTSDVVISATSADTSEVTVSPATLTFTNANWNTPQTVTITGVNDNLVDGNQTTNVTVSVVDGSSDDAYDSVADSTMTVTTSDDDTVTPTVTIAPTTTVSPTTTVAPSTGTVSLSAVSSGNASSLVWAASDAGSVSSFSLAHRDPASGAFTTTNSFDGTTLDHLASGLGDGTHSFRILALYNDGTAVASNVATVTISGGEVTEILIPTTIPPTTTVPTTTVSPTTTIPPAATTALPTTTPPTTTVSPTSTVPTTTVSSTTTIPPAATTALPTTTLPTTTLPAATTAPPTTTVVNNNEETTEETVSAQDLTREDTEEPNDESSLPTTGLIAALAGLAAAAGLALTSAGQTLWRKITGFLAGSILGFLILGRKRNRCEHCNKLVTSKEGILVDEDDNYECDENPEGDHHQLKEK